MRIYTALMPMSCGFIYLFGFNLPQNQPLFVNRSWVLLLHHPKIQSLRSIKNH
jgi:hypothetical protein